MVRRLKQIHNTIMASSRIFFIFLCAILLPRLFLVYINSTSDTTPTRQKINFKLGVENLSDDFLQNIAKTNSLNYSAALVTNQTGIDQSGQRTLDILLKRGVQVSLMFAPEHGIHGNHMTTSEVHNTFDQSTKIPVISLWNKGSAQDFTQKMLDSIDVIFFDIQDSGMRHYTYITALFKLLNAAATFEKTVVVLDRPNHLGAFMEGPLVDTVLKSAISYASIPLRHGMTVGELANYYNNHVLDKAVDLHVIPMKNYNRYHPRDRGLSALLSPNIKNMASCHGYSFLGLVGEIAPFDIAIGTDRAFQCILLPESLKFSKNQWYQLHLLLKQKGIETSFYRYFSERKKKFYSGLQLYITDINNFSSFNTLLDMLMFFKKSGIKLTFSPMFDKAIGTPLVRSYVQGNIRRSQLEKIINRDLFPFFKKALDCYMYQPLPCPIELNYA